MVHAIVAATTSCAMPSVTVSSESCKAGRRPEKEASAHERARLASQVPTQVQEHEEGHRDGVRHTLVPLQNGSLR